MYLCSIRSKNCSEVSSAPSQGVKSTSSKVDSSTAGLSVQFMSPSVGKSAANDTDLTRTSQRISNYAVASASASSSAASRRDKDTQD